MSDNKVRLSPDVLEKAETIAAEWGLKNARAAIEAVFRCYCDVYRQGQQAVAASAPRVGSPSALATSVGVPVSRGGGCDALEALDELLAL